MCCRYYYDDDTLKDIERVIDEADEAVKKKAGRDIHPSEEAAVICAEKNRLLAVSMKWGFPSEFQKGLLINARSETAMEKKSFRESILCRRCLIPAKAFYEWDRGKEKHVFTLPDAKTIYMAGCYEGFDKGLRFVILTAPANESMLPVHDRMPLILTEREVRSWIFTDDVRSFLADRKLPLLKSRKEYDQLSLFLY